MPKKTTKKTKAKTAHNLWPFPAVWRKKRDNFMRRRPHKSFKLTYRRDYKRSLKLPGYFSFTKQVIDILWQNKKTFSLLIAVYAVLSAVLVGIASQNTYSQLQQALGELNQSSSLGLGELGKAGLLAISAVSGNLNTDISEAQQVYSFFLVIMTWLTTVWLLRAILAGSKPRLRDAIYNAGSPIMATMVVVLILLIQSLPLVAAIMIYSAIASVSGLLSMAFGIAAALLIVLSLYWLTSSFMALIIVTLPGMYPWQAVRSASDLVIGRRIRILMRVVWLFVTIGIIWSITIIPTILFSTWLEKVLPFVSNIPIVPFVLLVITTCISVWVSAYVYLLYRKVVDDESSPA